MGYTKRDSLKLIAGGVGVALVGHASTSEASSTAADRRTARIEARRAARRRARIEARRGRRIRDRRLARKNARIAARTQISKTFNTNFKIGTAMASYRIEAQDASAVLAQKQFNSMTPEYELKHPYLLNSDGEYDFTIADTLVNWAIENGQEVRGHTLLWHVETPDFMLEGTPAEIKLRLENHISTVMTHFKGRIKIWDVVNEVISQDIYSGAFGVGPDRRNNWYEAVGSADYVEWAFRAARAADPDALLFLNDYDTENPIKQAWLVEMLQRFKANDIPIDGVGHQFHLALSTQASDALGAIDAVDNQFMNLINHVTELDMSMYEDPGSCWESGTNCEADIGLVPTQAQTGEQAQRLKDLFDGLMLRSSVESVTFWGVRDGDSWLNYSPISRYNHPLLFDREGLAKPCFMAITNPSYVIPLTEYND